MVFFIFLWFILITELETQHMFPIPANNVTNNSFMFQLDKVEFLCKANEISLFTENSIIKNATFTNLVISVLSVLTGLTE